MKREDYERIPTPKGVIRGAVFDTETTGLYNKDRIVEIGIVVVDLRTGEKLDEFETLLNPQRDVGPTHIHGITASMVAKAPRFSDVIPDISKFLDGAVLVAHNLPFDLRMLGGEFERAGIEFDPGVGLCTLSRTHMKLAEACDTYGVPLLNAHRAIDDARATADLLFAIMEEEPELVEVGPASIDFKTIDNKPSYSIARGDVMQRTVSSDQVPPTRRRHMISLDGNDPKADPYLDLLGMALVDFDITAEENVELQEEARRLGLSDGLIASSNQHAIESISARPDLVPTNLNPSKVFFQLAKRLSVTWPLDAPRSVGSGNRVCMTGDLFDGDKYVHHDHVELLAKAYGWTIVQRITASNCSLLIAGDPMSDSRKANDAREFGVPIVSLGDFYEIAGIPPPPPPPLTA